MIKGGDNSVKSIKNTSVKSSKSVKKLYANVAAEPIYKYIKELRKQIKESKKKYFVFLDLKDNKKINELTGLLQKKDQLNYFFKNINRKNRIKLRGKDWGVWVTGFKHGATNDSRRKLGLVAYNINENPEFTTVMFFDSENFNENFNENNISTQIGEMKKYLKDPKSHPGENYIKPVENVRNNNNPYNNSKKIENLVQKKANELWKKELEKREQKKKRKEKGEIEIKKKWENMEDSNGWKNIKNVLDSNEIEKYRVELLKKIKMIQ